MPRTVCFFSEGRRRGIYSGRVLDLSSFDLEEIGNALADQTDYEHRWLINPQTGEIAFWTADTGIDGQTPIDLDDLDLVCIHPLPSWVWYQDMADFADTITDERAGRRLGTGHPGQRRLPPVQGRASRGVSGPAASRGTRSAMSALSAGPSNGWLTIRSSMTMLPAAFWSAIPIPICPDL